MARTKVIVLTLVLLLAIAIALSLVPTRGYRIDDLTRIQLQAVRELVARWQKVQGRLPSDEEGLENLVKRGMAKEVDLYDGWGIRFKYRCVDKTCSSARIYSAGPNKLDEQGGGDDLSIEVR
jgi:type II secretory pathway pseudopilin PulG